ncbi:SDR family NAD(P)-dependent oxidoreductase [Pseudaquabacterium rugosum]|jgi:NAD(P)-dependent dehydrogenase (short-subunit alcohol dehydrogenase family)|uniref:SDR family NAD(P)-dependent oxidoreductase n=1 Tax=Pseudaquabacterium rugosum TaxID=2984194 RepID=A0ABU9BGS5_9BURK
MTQGVFIQTPDESGVPASARNFSVQDRVVVITGAGQGIGRELARQYGAAGAVAIVADLDADKAARVAEEVTRSGGRAMAVAVDVGDRASVDAMVSAVVAQHGRVDVLVNNAAIFATLQKRPFDQIPVAEWEQVMRVNVTGVFHCVCAVAPHMRQAGWGRIVNISSDAVRLGVTNYLHYVASKSALIGMTASLARELGPAGITVNCIRPGGVATEVDRTVNPTAERRQQMLAQQCVPRGQVPADLVGIVMFLSTEASSFISGQTIACDGGLTHSS